MIEAYLRANNMFVDYNEVNHPYPLYFLVLSFFISFQVFILLAFVNEFQPQQDRVYSSYLELNLDNVEPCISGPKRYGFCWFL